MGRLLCRHNEYIIIEEDNGRGCVLINTAGVYRNHGHLKKLSTAKMLIGLMNRKIVPNSKYLRDTVLRISLDEEYRTKVRMRKDKEKCKQLYFNVNKGIKGR